MTGYGGVDLRHRASRSPSHSTVVVVHSKEDSIYSYFFTRLLSMYWQQRSYVSISFVLYSNGAGCSYSYYQMCVSCLEASEIKYHVIYT